MKSARVFVAGVIFVVALVALAVGAIYLAVPAHSLPSFFPGHAANVLGKHTHRGIAGIAVGAVLLVLSIVLAASGRRRRH